MDNNAPYLRTDVGAAATDLIRAGIYLFYGWFAFCIVGAIVILLWKALVVILVGLVTAWLIHRVLR